MIEFEWQDWIQNETHITAADINKLGHAIEDLNETKVDAEDGKGLSANDFTDEDAAKLDGIDDGAQVNVKSDWNAASGSEAEILHKPYIPENTSDLTNDSDFITSTEVDTSIGVHNASTNAHSDIRQSVTNEETVRSNADISLQSQIDALTSASDVVDVVGTYAELQAYDTSSLFDNDIIKVLSDETKEGAITYYRWVEEAFTFVGSQGAFYTKSETDTLLGGKVDEVAGKGLSTNDFTNSDKTAVETTLPNHISDTAIHITSSERATWNAKSDFNGDYDDLNNKPIILINNVTVSNWVSDSTYSGFPYKADISANGVTSGHTAYVTFGMTEALSGNYAPVCETGTNKVTVYSTSNTSIVIPTIQAVRA